MRRLTLEITAEERQVLEKAFRTHSKPHVRERAFALLKVSEGLEIQQVASQLPLPRQPQTVSDWVKRYKSAGITGLSKSPGSGRKATFSPSERSGGKIKGRASHAKASGITPWTESMDA